MATIAAATGRSDHRVAVVLGSGLSDVARALVDSEPIPFSQLGLPDSTIAGHEGSLHHGEVAGVPTLVFAGRVHLYEGHDARTVTRGVEAAIEAGCSTIILTNAVGVLDLTLEVGAPVLIADHLNLTGHNPLAGPHDGRGPRFLDLTQVYDASLRALARGVDASLRETVFAQLLGPTYETPAEVEMLRRLGAGTVGMSTALEAIMARYLGARVLGISVVTNYAAGVSGEPLSHDEVAAAGRAAAQRLEAILRGVIAAL